MTTPQVAIDNDGVPLSRDINPIQDAMQRLTAVCMEPRTWQLPYDQLSNGEQARASLARQLTDYAVIDEFTRYTIRSLAC